MFTCLRQHVYTLSTRIQPFCKIGNYGGFSAPKSDHLQIGGFPNTRIIRSIGIPLVLFLPFYPAPLVSYLQESTTWPFSLIKVTSGFSSIPLHYCLTRLNLSLKSSLALSIE